MGRRSRRRGGSRGHRRFPRWQVSDGRLVGAVVTARVLDLGPAGVLVETTRALRVGAPYAFTLELGSSSRRLTGRVRWCRLVGTRSAAGGDSTPIYRAGIVWRSGHLAPAAADRPRPG